MKMKHWKTLYLHLIFASVSAVWSYTHIGVVKAAILDNSIEQKELVLRISSSEDSRFSSKLFNKHSSKHKHFKLENEKKRQTPIILHPKILNTNKFESLTQISADKKTNTQIFTKSRLIPDISLAPILEPLPGKNNPKLIENNIKVLKTLGNKHTTDKNIIHVKLSNVSIPKKELSSQSIEIVQSQEAPPPPPPPPTPENVEKNPPPLESQPTDSPGTSPEEIDKKLDTLEDERTKKLERLLKLLQDNQKEQQSFNSELGIIRAEPITVEVPKPLEQKQPPSIDKPVEKFKPVGYLLGRIGYFNTSNIFSSRTNAIDDGLIFSGLTLAVAPFKIGPKTYINGSIDGNIFRYNKQSEFDYNQIKFNLGIYQQLSNKMYSEIGWNNQQLFYSKDSNRFNFSSGDKFLNENSFRLSVGRRDSLAPKLNLDSFYEVRLSLTNPPNKRNRVSNYVWLSLNYYLQKSLRVGIDYQFNLSNFLEKSREDQYHRLSANLKYGISDLSSINLQSGLTLGGSTDRNIDFDGWFFSINYSWDLGQF